MSILHTHLGEKTWAKKTGKLMAAAALGAILVGFSGAAAHAENNGGSGLINSTLNSVTSLTSSLSASNNGGSTTNSLGSSLSGTVNNVTGSVGSLTNLDGALGHDGDNVIVSTVESVNTTAGDVLAVDLNGDNLVSFKADKNTAKAVADLNNDVNVSSQHVALNGAQSDQVLNASVNLSGVSQAKSAHVEGGAIVLE